MCSFGHVQHQRQKAPFQRGSWYFEPFFFLCLQIFSADFINSSFSTSGILTFWSLNTQFYLCFHHKHPSFFFLQHPLFHRHLQSQTILNREDASFVVCGMSWVKKERRGKDRERTQEVNSWEATAPFNQCGGQQATQDGRNASVRAMTQYKCPQFK